jgi:ribosome maturation factor RimP
VSSPGLDRPLFTENQFQQFYGRRVKVKLSVPVDGRKKFKGVIQSVSDGNIVFDIGTKSSLSKRPTEELATEELEVLTVPFNSIEKANLIPEI